MAADVSQCEAVGSVSVSLLGLVILKSLHGGNSMKYKTRLNLAVFLIQTLLFTTSVHASETAEADQEIGELSPTETRAKGCFDVVLSPHSDDFYSVRDGLLTHYQIAPFKKIGSTIIDLAQLNDRLATQQCEVLITNDRSKLILIYREWIVVLDRSTGKLTNKLERKGELEREDSRASMLNENELVILSQYMEGPEESVRVWFKLTVLDANTLRLKRPVMDIQGKFEFSYVSCCTGIAVTKIQNRLFLSSGSTLAVLNSKTYEPELTLTAPKLKSFWQWYVSKNYQKLYGVPVRFVNDYLTQTEKDYGEPKEGIRDTFGLIIFDQATRQFNLEPTDGQKEQELRRWRRDLYEPLFWGPKTTRNKNYVASRGAITSRNANIYYSFRQYENGEAILYKSQQDGPLWSRSFELTPGARQYLMMKNREGKVVPINDITFNQYLRMDSQR